MTAPLEKSDLLFVFTSAEANRKCFVQMVMLIKIIISGRKQRLFKKPNRKIVFPIDILNCSEHLFIGQHLIPARSEFSGLSRHFLALIFYRFSFKIVLID